MLDLENNNWIINDPLRNTYEIYGNLTVMILLNLNHFWITQAELRCICKSKFHVCYFFFRNYENPGKNVINPSCPKRPKIINWKRKWHGFFFFFALYYGASKTFHLFWGTKKKWKIMSFCTLFKIGTTWVKTVFL